MVNMSSILISLQTKVYLVLLLCVNLEHKMKQLTRTVVKNFWYFNKEFTIGTTVEVISCNIDEDCMTGIAVTIKYDNEFFAVDAGLLTNKI